MKAATEVYGWTKGDSQDIIRHGGKMKRFGQRMIEQKLKYKAWYHGKDTTAEEDALVEYGIAKKAVA